MATSPPPDPTPVAVGPEHPDSLALQPGDLPPLVRGLLIAAGSAALVVGVIGIVVPLLPTTPFLLVAAACYARASTRLYRWLLGQPSLGPIVTEWRRSRQLPPGVKRRALAAITLTFSISIVLIESVVLSLALAIGGLVLALFLWRIPTAPIRPG